MIHINKTWTPNYSHDRFLELLSDELSNFDVDRYGFIVEAKGDDLVIHQADASDRDYHIALKCVEMVCRAEHALEFQKQTKNSYLKILVGVAALAICATIVFAIKADDVVQGISKPQVKYTKDRLRK